MRQEVFDGAFFNGVFGEIRRKTPIDFMNMFHQAVKQRNLELITRIKQCFEAQYARVPKGNQGKALLTEQ